MKHFYSVMKAAAVGDDSLFLPGMELSICIPVYNFDIGPLLSELRESIDISGAQCELIVMDDASDEKWQGKNAHAAAIRGAAYIPLEKNVGRAAIRNRLAGKASGRHILFLDCDMRLRERQFISNYLRLAADFVTVGGHIYPENPADREKLLHWCYGTRVESKRAGERQKNPYRSFMTGNFMIQRKLFLDIRFDESIVAYGHEDTLFGLELMIRQVPIIHIDNPTIHLGLMPTGRFLQKNKQAVGNLLRIYLDKESYRAQLTEMTALLSAFARLRAMRLLRCFDLWAGWRAASWMRKLESGCTASALTHFSMLKLHWLVREYLAEKSKVFE